MKYIVLDIETIAQPETEIRQRIPAFDPAKVSLGNATKPETIARIVEDARKTHGDDLVAKGALYPEYGQVAIFGGYSNNGPMQLSADGGNLEVHLLETAWNFLFDALEGSELLTGFNIKGFDFPFLVKRSWILGVKVPRQIFNTFKPRYPWSESIIDLLEVYRCGEHNGKTGGLNAVCRALGIPCKNGDGKDFGELWRTNKKAALAYNAEDLRIAAMVAERLIG